MAVASVGAIHNSCESILESASPLSHVHIISDGDLHNNHTFVGNWSDIMAILHVEVTGFYEHGHVQKIGGAEIMNN